MRAPKRTGGKLPEMFKVLLKPSGHLHQLLILILVLKTSLNSQNEVQLCVFLLLLLLFDRFYHQASDLFCNSLIDQKHAVTDFGLWLSMCAQSRNLTYFGNLLSRFL